MQWSYKNESHVKLLRALLYARYSIREIQAAFAAFGITITHSQANHLLSAGNRTGVEKVDRRRFVKEAAEKMGLALNEEGMQNVPQ